MELVWITDPHLNFLHNVENAYLFGNQVGVQGAELESAHLVITGDIAECPRLYAYLTSFISGCNYTKPLPVSFILGNHDAYGGSIAEARLEAQRVVTYFKSKDIVVNYLTTSEIIPLNKETCLVGSDGWYDAILGDPYGSNVLLYDFTDIEELRLSFGNRSVLIGKLRKLSDDYAEAARKVLLKAVKSYKTIVFATHVPPFREACWHAGSISDQNWLPWFTSKLMGDMLLEVAQENPDVTFDVLCGHTHGEGTTFPLPNLHVLTGKAVYGSPKIHRMLTY